MILSDSDIRERLTQDLTIDPLDNPDLQIQPASVDLRLGREFLEFDQPRVRCIHPDHGSDLSEYMIETVIEEGNKFVLHPGEFVLGTTMERVELPDDLLANVEGRSSLGRMAIVVHATAGLCDPGYQGEITLELSNLGPAPVALKPGMRVCQLVFKQMMSAADSPYGVERGSKYQNQEGPQASRIGEDPENAIDGRGVDIYSPPLFPEGALGVVDRWVDDEQVLAHDSIGSHITFRVGDDPGHVRVETDTESGREFIYPNGEDEENEQESES